MGALLEALAGEDRWCLAASVEVRGTLLAIQVQHSSHWQFKFNIRTELRRFASASAAPLRLGRGARDPASTGAARNLDRVVLSFSIITPCIILPVEVSTIGITLGFKSDVGGAPPPWSRCCAGLRARLGFRLHFDCVPSQARRRRPSAAIEARAGGRGAAARARIAVP